jgi:hypothetical protein
MAPLVSTSGMLRAVYHELWLNKIAEAGVHRRAELFYQQPDGLQVFASYGGRRMLRSPLVLRNHRCSREVHGTSGLDL